MNKPKENENQGLELLYTEWAIAHLAELQLCIERMQSFSNLNMNNVVEMMYKEYNKLVKNNSAYEKADRILKDLDSRGWRTSKVEE